MNASRFRKIEGAYFEPLDYIEAIGKAWCIVTDRARKQEAKKAVTGYDYQCRSVESMSIELGKLTKIVRLAYDAGYKRGMRCVNGKH